ncbi:hypothetical protein H0H87_000603 [Tephrocybe sp. NHM501043]|nr:hypothetical protein H0H87_000603 [Tephrocybe sp. NHM501043]
MFTTLSNEVYTRNHLKDHPAEILVHGLKHGIRKLVARTAPLLLHSPLEYLLPHLPDRFLIPWVRYRTHWTRVWMSTISSALSTASMAKVKCTSCNQLPHDYSLDAMAILSSRLSALQNLDIIFPPHTPICCSDTLILLEALRDTLRAEIITIPTFEDLAFPLDAVPADGSIEHVIFQSSDGRQFDLKEGAIKALSNTLLPVQYDKFIQLPETSATIELLFAFIVAAPHPNL